MPNLPNANAVANAFVTLDYRGSTQVSGISADIQTPGASKSWDQIPAYWVGIEFGSPSNVQFVQVGIYNQKVFWADSGPYENSGNPVICYIAGFANNCPMPVYVDSITLQPNSIHNYALRYSAGQWQFLVDGSVVHSLADNDWKSGFHAYYALETQWTGLARYSNQGETIRAPIVRASNIMISLTDGSQTPLLTINNGLYSSYDPQNNVNGMEVDCSSLSIRTGEDLAHTSKVHCDSSIGTSPISNISNFGDVQFLLLMVGIVVIIIIVIIKVAGMRGKRRR